MRRLAIIFLIAQVLLIIFSWQRLPPELPLFYSQPWGKGQLTSPTGLLLLPFLSLAVVLVNSLLLNLIPKEEKLIPKILVSATAVFGLLCLITLTKIILLIA